MKKSRILAYTISYLSLCALLCGCGEGTGSVSSPPGSVSSGISHEATPVSSGQPSGTAQDGTGGKPSGSAASAGTSAGLRDNTPVCLVPMADGVSETRNDVAVIDYSHSDQGYICANYTGTVSKIKLIVTGPDGVQYKYDLHNIGYEVFPLSSGNGTYEIGIYENVSGTSYSTCLFAKINVAMSNTLGPFLYPNQYVNFNADSKTVAKGAELAAGADTDIDVVISVYNYITSNITYDYVKAEDPPTGYTTDIDEILSSNTGICLDYAAVMASMLRSQQIPTRLEVGYAQDAYHAWISVYTDETGWLNGLIEIKNNVWTLIDPTFGANSSEKALKKFIGDGSNYQLQKVY